MRKLLLFLILNLTLSTYAQHQFSVGLDVKNAIVGSDPTDNEPATDLTIQYKVRQKHIEVGLSYERFNAIEYQDYTVFLGYCVGEKNVFYTNIGFGQIVRKSNIGTLNYEINVGFDKYIYKNIGLSYELNINRRMDLQFIYDVYQPTISNNIKLIYKL
jgi:hypothetical protein